jgi:F-type H+-transporting ATPase subunit b
MEYESIVSVPWAHGTFWVFISVIIFAALFGRKILVVLEKMLDARADGVRFALDEAARLKAEAEVMLADAKRRRDEALVEAKDMLAHAKDEASRFAAELRAEAEARTRARERMAHDRIASAEASAIAEVRAVAVEVAIAAASQALREGALSPAEDSALVDHAIAEIPSAFTRRAA